MNGAELVAKRHAVIVRQRRVDANVVESAQAEEMRDGVPDRRNRQRLPHRSFDDADDRRVAGLASFDPSRTDAIDLPR